MTTPFKPSAGSSALLFGSALCALLMAAPVQAADAKSAERPVAFAIARQPLDSALTQFARTAGIQLLYAPDVVLGKQAEALSGSHSVVSGLNQLLNGTGLVARPVRGDDGKIRAWSIVPAASPEDSVQSVVVTALKRSTVLSKVPAAIVALGGRELSDRRIQDANGLVDEVPGVSINYAFGGAGYGLLSVRGIGGADDYKPAGSPSVALHVDGVYQTSNVYLAMPLFDLERMEVLKGPQGTLYGRNTTAGVISAVTRNPTEAPSGFVDASLGNYESRRIEAAAGGRISDAIGVRLAVLRETGGGFMNGEGAGTLAGF
ncbi:MAG: TonB-dependent receptor plug domain-containing protein, partial [Asticcacaulis sp.]